MRPVSKKQSSLRYPLDQILGSEAQVRLLRVMSQNRNAAWTVSVISDLTDLSPWGTQKALKRLVDTGIVIRKGQGKSLQYLLHGDNPLMRSLCDLFEQEHERYTDVVSSLRKELSEFSEIRGAWLDNLPSDARGAVELRVVADVKAVPWMSRELRTRLAKVERKYDLVIEITVYTRADGKEPREDSIILIAAPDSHVRSGSAMKTHHDADERSRRFALGVVELMKDDPSLSSRAKRHLDMLLREDQGSAAHDLLEWKQLLETYSPARLAELLVSDSSRAVRLRQSSPFFAVLTAAERDEVLDMAEERP